MLAALSARRAEWLAGAGLTPIEQHAMLSDQRTAAIVTPDARITWLCVPRIDSGAIFAELLGGEPAGHFSIRPANVAEEALQTYVDDSLVLRTDWPSVSVTDYLDCSEGRPKRISGRTDLVRVLEGTGVARVEFAPRLDFGRFPTQLDVRDGGLEVVNAADLVVLRSPGVEWTIEDVGAHQTAVANVDLSQGAITLELRCGTGSLRPDRTDELDRRTATASFWADWAAGLDIPDDLVGVDAGLVRRSALTLKALCYGPTGAILAAATTSLPEFIGGVRNWDYRYCWIRDAPLSAGALVRLGSIEEGMDLLDWLLQVIESSDVGPERLRRSTPSPAGHSRPRPPSKNSPGTQDHVRCGSATLPITKCNSTSSARPRTHPPARRCRCTPLSKSLASRRRSRRRRRQALDRARPGHLGSAFCATPPRQFQGDVLGDRRSSDPYRKRNLRGVSGPSGKRCATPSRPTSSPTAGATISTRSPPPTTGPTSTPPFSPSACSACSSPTTRATPPSPQSRRGCGTTPSTATSTKTDCPVRKEAST